MNLFNGGKFEDIEFMNYLSIIILTRMSKILQFLEELKQIRYFVKTFKMMANPFMNMIFTLYTVYFIYVIIGVYMYGGRINGEMF